MELGKRGFWGLPFWEALLWAPLAIRKLSWRAWMYLFVYLAIAAGLLGTTAALLAAYKDNVRQWLLDYLFPEGWQFAVEKLVDYFFAQQLRAVIVNAVIGASLMLVTMLLFPLKEALSHRFESDASLTDRAIDEFPLWFQAWEEIKLFLLFITVQGCIFWIGYHPDPWRKQLSLILSYLYLFFTFAIDFISPIVQRHRGRFSIIIKTLAKRPVSSLVFGALFSLPPIVVGRIWEAHPDWSFGSALTWLFFANVLGMVWAAVAGTWLGARWLDRFEETKQSRIPVRILTWVLLLGSLAANVYAFAAVGASLHHKSQILKCHYDVDWGSLLGKKIEVGVHLDMTVDNPTQYRLEIENNRVDIKHHGKLVASTRLAPLDVPAGGSTTQRMAFKLALNRDAILSGSDLFTTDGWEFIMYVEVASWFWFPIYLFPGVT